MTSYTPFTRDQIDKVCDLALQLPKLLYRTFTGQTNPAHDSFRRYATVAPTEEPNGINYSK
jgi:hypothetical protein